MCLHFPFSIQPDRRKLRTIAPANRATIERNFPPLSVSFCETIVRLLRSVLDLFLRPNCLLCDRPSSDELCDACQRRLLETRLRNPHQHWRGDLPLFAWGTYDGSLKRAIATLKYNDRPQLARPLGQWMGRAWTTKTAPTQGDRFTVVPVPMHPEKQRQRGFNQAEQLARHFCQFTRLPLAANGLQRVRNTQPLFQLSPAQRRQTLNQAIALGSDFQRRSPQHPVLLLDDIYTTGTTIREAARVLHQHRIPLGGVVVLAKTQASRSSRPRRRPQT